MLRRMMHFLYHLRANFPNTVRFNALSRAIERALQKEGIPSRILGGHKFLDREEVGFRPSSV